MSKREEDALSMRERQIMDICFAAKRLSARDIWDKIPDQPTYATVRKLLMILVDKGHLRRTREGKKYLYTPIKSRRTAAKTAVNRLVQTFFNGSVEEAVMGMLDINHKNLSTDELKRIGNLIETARKDKNRL